MWSEDDGDFNERSQYVAASWWVTVIGSMSQDSASNPGTASLNRNCLPPLAR